MQPSKNLLMSAEADILVGIAEETIVSGHLVIPFRSSRGNKIVRKSMVN